ncbi:armadillo-type protein [Scheffersomyces xylosifermentans]|uniref:armadillo-type protein n=1 Tax=Scheffersomyces xylosifermentans TaxID=1304137 RepID=UPI00315D470E
MNANVLLECFSATLQADQNIRLQAEVKLRELVATPGFLGACLDIIASEGTAIDAGVKKATAVYFKNRVVKFWSSTDGQKIDADERPVIKERILPVLVHSDYNTKQQLIPVVRILISHEFSHWTGLLEQTGTLLQQVPSGNNISDRDLSQLYTGLLCFSEISRKFRWIQNDERQDELYPIIDSAFPHLLNIGNAIVANAQNITEVSAEIVKLILKSYKFVTYYDLPTPLQSREAITAWGAFHEAVINMPTPEYIATSNLSEQEKCFFQFSKCQKWSIANMHRIFQRYASSTLSKKFKYPSFHEAFMNEFVSRLLQNYLALIEQWCHGKKWISSTALYHLLEFLSHCVSQKSTWHLIKPYYENLISFLIYPLLCPSDTTLEIFDEDPHEYIHVGFDILDEFNSPDIAALGLLVTFAYKRKNTTLNPIVTIIHSELSQLQQQQETLEVAKKKDGILKMLGGISSYIAGFHSPYKDQMESFLSQLVFPNLTSTHEFLRARTLDVVAKFADVEFKNEQSKSMLYQGILRNFDSSQEVSLPVSFESALAIQAFLPQPEFKEVLSQIIIPTMSRLLELSNEIDNDAISVVMQECVENFSDQLQPFGVDLMTKLVEQFMRLAVEINQASNVDVEDFDGDYEDQSEKVMAAIGLLNTMITVLLSFENSTEICLKLEEVFSPAIQYVLENKLDDFIAEIGELMENSTFLLRSISPVMWKNFELLSDAFTSGIAIMYLEELIQCLQNFMIYGAEELRKNQHLVEIFVNIFRMISEGDDNQIGYSELIYGCELSQTFILSLQNQSVHYIPNFIASVVALTNEDKQDKHHVKNTGFDVNVTNVIAASIVYDAPTSLRLLQESNQLHPFFSRWFSLIPQLKRVYDLKLSVLALLSLMSHDEILGQLDSGIVEQMGLKLATLLRELPKAIENLEKKRKNFNEGDFSGGDNYKYGDENDAWENAGSEDLEDILREGEAGALEAGAEEGEHAEGRHEYLNFLEEEGFKLKSSGYFDEEDEPVIEDPLATTPLDTVDVFSVIKDFMLALQSNNAAKFNALFGSLGESDQRLIADIFEVVQ